MSDAMNQENSQTAENIYSHLMNYFKTVHDQKVGGVGPTGPGNLTFPVGAASPEVALGQSPSDVVGLAGQENVENRNPNLTPPEPCISVSVEGIGFQYQLTEEDITKVFSRYGPLKGVNIHNDGSAAFVTYQNLADAECAVRELNRKVLSGVQGHLKVTWCVPPGSSSAVGGMGSSNYLSGYPNGFGGVAGTENDGERVIRKYTCRFDIGIENDKDFHVARKIIGQKGANMKRIVKQTDAKLRLRGKGSGFLEGAQKLESNEPLHLCISCKDYTGYRTAIYEITRLMESVYAEYKQYCTEKGLAIPENLKVEMKEQPLLSSGSRKSSPPPTLRTAATGLMFPSPADFWDPTTFYASQLIPMPSVPFSIPPSTEASVSGIDVPLGYPMPTMYNPLDILDRTGLPSGAGVEIPSPEEIEKLIEERNEARRQCNFKEADRIRELLRQYGIGLMDEPGGRGTGSEVTTWRYWRQ